MPNINEVKTGYIIWYGNDTLGYQEVYRCTDLDEANACVSAEANERYGGKCPYWRCWEVRLKSGNIGTYIDFGSWSMYFIIERLGEEKDENNL